MDAALEQARLAREAGEVPIGAVLVLDGRIVARGFNRPIRDADPTAHAEIVTLREAARATGNYRLTGSVLYVTLEPCLMCVGALVHARVAEVVFGAAEPKSGALVSTIRGLDLPGLNHRFMMTSGVREEDCRALIQGFFRERRLSERSGVQISGGGEIVTQDVEAQGPAARAQMLIRRPAAEVFGAFVDPAVTTRFWFSKGSGRLVPGRTVQWTWEMYGASTDVLVRVVEPDRRILIDWDGPDRPTSVEWTFEPRGPHATLVRVRNWGFHGDAQAVADTAANATGGFSFLLAGLKAFLEYGIELNLVADHDPDALVAGWRARQERA